jgi:bla regulator protein BlaR1
MMSILIGIALKSLIVAGLALGLLALMSRRSAAERSWVAHIGLLALVVLAVAPIALPRWSVETPALFAPSAQQKDDAARSLQPPTSGVSAKKAAAMAAPARTQPTVSAAAVATAAYALPAAILLFITLMALFRLVALRARAEVLVDGHWLSALARAQRRMGFKHGTALLTSNDLSSPISWGLMRPVILLNPRAVEAAGEAEAIIAHELAHVARMDWIKLLLARVATALFWFNPLVWMLAREAHQLREEAADDSVLGADIPDTDYAQLLVGVARHECPGMLLGAHGVAPSKGSLARRVARVLDGKSVRGPVARSFAWGVLAGAVLIAAPLAALTLTPTKPAPRGGIDGAITALAATAGSSAYYPDVSDAPSDLPNIIADGISAAVAAVAPTAAQTQHEARVEAIADAVEAAAEVRGFALAEAGKAVSKARAATQTIDESHIDRIIEMKAIGISPEYVAAMRAAVPRLRNAEPSDLVGMKAVGVTPEYARSLAAVGFRDLDEGSLTEARAVGLNADYARALARAGIPPDLDDYVQLHAVGVPTSYVESLRRAGYLPRSADRLTEMWVHGVKPGDLNAPPPGPKRPPAPPTDWDPTDEDPDGG